MSVLDSLLGQGGIDATFSDWNQARDFVIFQTILPNPRLSDEVKIELQKMEEDAYNLYYGKMFDSEKTEIGKYFNYLRNNFPSITDDERFLSIYISADEVQAGEPSVSVFEEVLEPTKDTTNKLLIGVGVVALVYFLTRD